MKAMVIGRLGGPEVFEARVLDTPTLGPNEVLVRVRASSVNPADVGARRGAFGPHGVALPAVLGYDVAGVIEQVGPGVAGWAAGDAVYYAIPAGAGQGGGYAEFHAAPGRALAKMPANLSFTQAAAVPVAGGTAWAALISRAALTVGETVLIHGGAGGVGSFAVQIAKAAGAFVFATCGAYDADRVRGLGADRVIDYRTDKFAGARPGGNGRAGGGRQLHDRRRPDFRGEPGRDAPGGTHRHHHRPLLRPGGRPVRGREPQPDPAFRPPGRRGPEAGSS